MLPVLRCQLRLMALLTLFYTMTLLHCFTLLIIFSRYLWWYPTSHQDECECDLICGAQSIMTFSIFNCQTFKVAWINMFHTTTIPKSQCKRLRNIWEPIGIERCWEYYHRTYHIICVWLLEMDSERDLDNDVFTRSNRTRNLHIAWCSVTCNVMAESLPCSS